MGVPQHYLEVLNAIYSRLEFFVWDRWGESKVFNQEEGMRQGDPLSCFLLLLLMTVVMHDAKEQYVHECRDRGLDASRRETIAIFGFEDVEFADDSNFIQMSLPCMRIFVRHYILEGRLYGLEANMGKSVAVAISDTPGIQCKIRHPDGLLFKVELEVKTLGILYGKCFDSARLLVAGNIGTMYGLMDRYKRVWASPISLKKKCEYHNALVWSKGRWSMHLFHFTKQLRTSLDGAQARMLRRIAKIPAPFISRISHTRVRKRCKVLPFSSQVLKSQLRWLGHILRRPEDDPLRLVCFEPGTELRPRLTGTSWKKRVGRPRSDWGQVFISMLCKFIQKTRSELLQFVKDRKIFITSVLSAYG